MPCIHIRETCNTRLPLARKIKISRHHTPRDRWISERGGFLQSEGGEQHAGKDGASVCVCGVCTLPEGMRYRTYYHAMYTRYTVASLK